MGNGKWRRRDGVGGLMSVKLEGFGVFGGDLSPLFFESVSKKTTQ